MAFIGREVELARISKVLSCREQQNNLVYGRRRVGKGELIKHALELHGAETAIYFECRQTSERDNVASLMASIAAAMGSSPRLALPRSRQGMSLSWGWKRCTGRGCPLPGIAARAQGDYVVVEHHALLVRLSVPQLLDVKTSVEVAGDKYRHVAPLWSAAP